MSEFDSDLGDFGAALKHVRESAGVTIESISETTNISVTLLLALERGDLSGWPTGLNGRAYLRQYANRIGLSRALAWELGQRLSTVLDGAHTLRAGKTWACRAIESVQELSHAGVPVGGSDAPPEGALGEFLSELKAVGGGSAGTAGAVRFRIKPDRRRAHASRPGLPDRRGVSSPRLLDRSREPGDQGSARVVLDEEAGRYKRGLDQQDRRDRWHRHPGTCRLHCETRGASAPQRGLGFS